MSPSTLPPLLGSDPLTMSHMTFGQFAACRCDRHQENLLILSANLELIRQSVSLSLQGAKVA